MTEKVKPKDEGQSQAAKRYWGKVRRIERDAEDAKDAAMREYLSASKGASE